MLANIKKPCAYLVFFWAVIILASVVTGSAILSAFTLCYTGLLPFICIVLWLSNTLPGEKLRAHAKKWSVAIYLSWFVFLYAIYAQKWAAEMLNQVFAVDARYLSITFNLLAFLFTPFGLLYQPSVLSALWYTLIITASIACFLIPFFLMSNVSFRKILKFSFFLFLFVILYSFFITAISNIVSNKDQLIRQFALWADFSSHHLCSDPWVNNTESVLFLSGDRVLAYHPHNPEGTIFSVEICNFKRTY